MSPVRTRLAVPGDAPRCADIVFSSLREHGITPDPEGADRDVRAFGAREGRFRDLVAEMATDDAGAASRSAKASLDGPAWVVGIACLEPWDDGGWISKVFVAKEARGLGIGRALLERILAEARAQGMQRLGLTTRSVFSAAIRLYERFGFVRSADPPQRGIGSDLSYELVL